MEKILGVFFPFTTTTSTIATDPLITHPTPPPIIQTLTLNIHTCNKLYLSFPLVLVFTLLLASISLYLYIRFYPPTQSSTVSYFAFCSLFLHSHFSLLSIAACQLGCFKEVLKLMM